MTLLNKARNVKRKLRRDNIKVSKDEVELALALIKGEVTYQQASDALGHTGPPSVHPLSLLAKVFRQGVREEWINVDWNKKEKNND